MDLAQMICCILFLGLSAGSFCISYSQFKEKGYLFNNAYFWASQKERQEMDKNRESKKPYYRQSGFAWMLIGVICLAAAAYLAVGRIWLLFLVILLVITTVVYAIVSSVKIERQMRTNMPPEDGFLDRRDKNE